MSMPLPEAASREFQIMVKPIGSVCNIDCKYCYYLSKRDLYPGATSFKFDEALLDRYVAQHIAASPRDTVLFSWHGGEPTVLGVDYYRRVMELQKKHAPPGKEILNGIQTNGTLIDEEWCEFLAQHKWYVGLSLDGPRELHDTFRYDKQGRATHGQVVAAYKMLRKHGIHVDVLCVVNAKNARQPKAVYRFFKDLGVRFLQFLPVVARKPDGTLTPETVPAQAYGEFLNEIFDEWVRNDTGKIVIQNFDEAARPYLGAEHALCIFRKTCGDVAALEHNGDLYACDHYVRKDHLLGNIRDKTIAEMIESPFQQEFGRKKADLPKFCKECEFLDLCNGGCPKDRLISAPDGEPGLNYLCAGFKTFFGHTKPYFQELAALNQAGQPIEELTRRIREREAQALPKAGRNDPCPCGSGKKFKRCCMAKALA